MNFGLGHTGWCCALARVGVRKGACVSFSARSRGEELAQDLVPLFHLRSDTLAPPWSRLALTPEDLDSLSTFGLASLDIRAGLRAGARPHERLVDGRIRDALA